MGVTYTLELTTGPDGELPSGSGQITVSAPAGTQFPAENDSGVEGAVISDVYDETAAQDLGDSRGGAISDNGATVTWTLEPTIPAGHRVKLVFTGVTNPAVGTYQLAVSTSADTAQALTAAYTLTAPQSVSAPSIQSVSTSAAGATGVTYKVRFTTSSTGALTAGGGQITLVAPAGTGFVAQNDSGVEGVVIADIYDETAAQDLGDSRGGVTATAPDGGSAVTWTVEPAIPAGHEIELTLTDVTNPVVGSYQWTVSTSADAQPAQTPAFAITAAQQVIDPSVTLSSTAAGEDAVSYTVEFTTSSSGELEAGAGRITLAAPAGTAFTSQNDNGVEGVVGELFDETTSQDLGQVDGGVTSDGGSTVTWTVPTSIAAGDTLDLSVDGVTNPAAGSYNLGVSTSSDPDPAQAPFTTVQVHGTQPSSVSDVTVNVTSSTAGGALSAYSLSFVTSADGALSPQYGDSITLVLPPGTSAFEGDVFDGDQEINLGGCDGTGTVVCFLDGGVQAGDTVTVDFYSVTNPGPGTYSIDVYTSADTVPAASAPYTITPEQGVSQVTTPTVVTTAGGTTSTYSVSFTTSSTGAMSAMALSYVTVHMPAGTDFTGSGFVYDHGESVGTGYCAGTTSMTCYLNTDVQAGDTLTVTFNATDPQPGTYTLGISTSSDTTAVTSPPYSIGLSVKLSASPASGAAPLQTSFTIAPTDPTGGKVTYSLAYGDGAATTGTIVAPYPPVTVDHTYVAGFYTPTVQVTDTGGQAAKDSASVTAVGVNLPVANAGDAQTAPAGTPVTLSGTRSTPAASISSYQWSFGDGSTGSGATVQHTYSQPGTYTAALTITVGVETYSAQTTITVVPPTTKGLTITVTSGSAPLAGASIAVIDSSGTRYSATTDAKGDGTVAGLPDGTYTADVYEQGYLPATVSATQTNGTGTASVSLQPGSISQTSVTSAPLTAAQIQQAGLDPNDPANQNAYQFSVNLDLKGTQDSGVSVDGDLTGCGFWDTSVTGAQPDDSSGGCSDVFGFSDDGYTVYAEPQTQQSQPVIAWMVVPDSAQWTKEFFNVSVLITNLAPNGFSFDSGTVTLGALPAGLSLAPLATPQPAGQPMPSVPAGGSQSVTWVLRGDAEGFYGINASYQGTLDPGAFPLTIPIASAADAVHVWGASAIQMTVDADSAATEGSPFLVRVGLTNVADVPVYNAQVQLSATGTVGYIYQPQQQLTYQSAAIAPGATFWTDYYRLVPAVSGTLDVSKSFVAQVSGASGLQTTFVTHPATQAPDMTATTQGGGVELDFTPPTVVATGYEVFYTSGPTTPFGSTPVQNVPLGASSTVIPNAKSGYYALSAVTPSGDLVMYNELAGTEGTGQQQAPSFSADTPPTTATVGQPYTYTFIATGSPDTMTYTLKGAPAWLTVNAGTGAVTGTPTSPATNFTFTVTASNGVSPNATTAPIAVTVQAAPTFTTASPPTTGTTGRPYSYTFVAAGTPNTITYSLVNAPAWLSIDASGGQVTGTPPAKTKTFGYAVQAANGVSPNATTAVFTVKVAAGPTAPQFTADSPPATVVVGAKYSYKFAATGTPSAMTYSLDGAPAWLTINASNGAVGGKAPAGSGNFSYAVTAGNGVGPDATSPTFQVSVTAAATTTKLTAPKSTAYGAENAGKFKVAVSAAGATPTGSVTVMEGPIAVCSAVLAGGSGTCTMLSPVQMNAGEYEFDAVYTPDSGSFSASVSIVTTSTVTPATTKTALKPTKKVTFGSETAAGFTATATANGVIPPGSVTVFEGTTALCTADLNGGVATCTLTATQLPIGVHTVKAVYTSPTGDITGSTSATAGLTVEPAKSTTTLTYTTPITSGAEQAAAFKATVTAPGVTPSGSVAIKQGDNILCTATLSAGTGTCTLTAAQLKTGTYSIKAVYTPSNANVAGSTSSAYSLVVR